MTLVEDLLMQGLAHSLVDQHGNHRPGGTQLLLQLYQQLQQLWEQMFSLGPQDRIEILQHMLQQVDEQDDAVREQ